MCEYCENGLPIGGGVENGDEKNACARQLAESLRDEIRIAVLRGTWRRNSGEDDMDRCIDELVDRALLHETKI